MIRAQIGILVAQYRKAVAAAAGPVVAALLIAAGDWIVTGKFDATQPRLAAAGALAGLASAILTAKVKPNAPAQVGVGSDELLREAGVDPEGIR